MKLSVIIVSYNVKYFVEQCLNSLAKATEGIEHEVFVVDNHSRDDSVRYLSHRFRGVSVIDCAHNLGFSRANNIAMRQSSGEYVLLLNPDTIVGEDTIRLALEFMDAHPAAGAAGVLMHNSDGSRALESRRGLPTPFTALCKMTGLCARFPRHRALGHYYMGYLGWDELARIEVVSGAFFLLRRSAIDSVGMLDEDFFMYGEDIDLSYRLLKGGFENWYLPFPILHYKGESTQKSSFRYVHVFYQAMLIFFRKHYGHLSFFITIPIKVAIYAKAAVALVSMLSHRLCKSLGFANRKRVDVRYFFVGGRQMLDRCRLISRRKGLNADYLEADSDAHIDWAAHVQRLGDKSPLCIVFDTDAFPYKQVIATMAAIANPNVRLGTFSGKAKVVITPDEVIW